MTSEIRANTLKNRVGLGTVSFTNTGIVVSGIVTANSFSGPISGTTGTFSGDITIPDKIIHAGDTNTAIRFPSDDTFSVETAGSERFRVNSDGSITHGTLQVDGLEGGSAQIRLRADQGDDNNDTYRLLVEDGGTGLKIQGYDGSFQTRLTLDTSGKFGIGTNNPDSLLHLYSATSPTIHLQDTTQDTKLKLYAQDSSSVIGNYSNHALQFVSNSLSRIQLTNDGKIQIGLPGNSSSLPGAVDSVSIRARDEGNLHIRDIGNLVSPPSGSGVGIDVLNNASNTVKDLCVRGASVMLRNSSGETLRITSTGKVLIGHDTPTEIGVGAAYQMPLQVIGTSYDTSGMVLARYANDGNGPTLAFVKSRNATKGSQTIVQANDNLGMIRFLGSDGTDTQNAAARIRAFCDTTPASNKIPGRITFETTDTLTYARERMRISSTGLTTLKNFNGTGLKLEGSGSDYQGIQLQVTDASASQTRNIFIDAVNETDAAVANQVGSIQSDGGSAWIWQTQPPGNRTDRRTERLRITADGKMVSTISSPDPYNTVNTNLELLNGAGNQGAGSRIEFTVGNGKAHIQSQVTGANSNSGTALVFATAPDANGADERLRITSDGQLTHTANKASDYTARFDQSHADNPAWIEIDSPSDNNLRPAYIQLQNAGTNKWGIGQVYQSTSSGAFHIGTGSHSQGNSKLTITTAGRIGVGNVDPGGAANGSIDISTSDNTTGHGVLTDQRGRSNLVIRNKSGTLYSYSQLMFTNGNDGYNSATFLRHTKGGYLQNENFVGDLILMTRVAGNGSANPDFREKTVWPGGTTKAKQIWWANGTGQQSNHTHMGWHHFAEQNPQGNSEFQYFTLDLGAASYSRAGLARYVILWNTGHASGTGHQTGEFRWFNHHQNYGACNILEHIILRRGYNNGSYYGWNDAPRMALFHSSNTGNDSCIHLRCQGRRSSGYDMGLYVTVFIDLYAPKSSNGNVTPGLRARGTSAPSDMSSSEFTNDGRNASYVSYQDAAPDMTQNP